MKINFNFRGKEYEVDEDTMKKYLKPFEVQYPITEFRQGDVFTNKSISIVIIKTYDNMYVCGGLNKNVFDLYSDNPRKYDEMLEFLNKFEYEFVENIACKL